MIHQLGHKMLYQIEKFSGELYASLGKVPGRLEGEIEKSLLRLAAPRISKGTGKKYFFSNTLISIDLPERFP
jgi:hypothetical protein